MATYDDYLPTAVIKDIYRRLLRGVRCTEKIQSVYCHLKHSYRYELKRLNIRDGEDLADCLDSDPSFFRCFIGDDDEWYVSPTTELTLCLKHSQESGSCRSSSHCGALHLCKFYLLSGQCQFEERCLFSHNLDRERQLLEDHYLDGFGFTELRRLFCLPWVRQGVTVPRVCRYYNKHRGCVKPDCRSMHLCGPYLYPKCKFGVSCIRNHDIKNPQVVKVLTWYGVEVKRPPTSILKEIRSFPPEDDIKVVSDAYNCSDEDEALPIGMATPHNRPLSRSSSAARGLSALQLQLDLSQQERQQTERKSRRDSVQVNTQRLRSRTATPFPRPHTISDQKPVSRGGGGSIPAQRSNSQTSSLTLPKFFIDSTSVNTDTSARTPMPRAPTDDSPNDPGGVAASSCRFPADSVKKHDVKESSCNPYAPVSRVVDSLRYLQRRTGDLELSDKSPTLVSCPGILADDPVPDVDNAGFHPEVGFFGDTHDYTNAIPTRRHAHLSPSVAATQNDGHYTSAISSRGHVPLSPSVVANQNDGHYTSAISTSGGVPSPSTLAAFENSVARLTTGGSALALSSRDHSAMSALFTAPPLQPDSFLPNTAVTHDLLETRNGHPGAATRQTSCPADTQPSERQPLSGRALQQSLMRQLSQMSHQVAQLQGADRSQLQSLSQQMAQLQRQVLQQQELEYGGQETSSHLSVMNPSVERSVDPFLS